MFTVEINGIAPIGIVTREVVLRIFAEVVAIWPKMVINNIKNYAEAMLMCRLDHSTQVVRSPVVVKGRK